ncbi:malonic semialdehyde reductase [Polymorphobacter fuscus]|uniref:Putative NADH dehydrogenase/NAD(P)H nitroreductase F3168_12390 n=1 Tax=Sandarakinorhabdus fusca TaxID=1439888 RepID=A0A7C9GQ65_9SPHN|nr:malonic semialdehyde reductase [Polymorphobacter fuscus]KAB7645605.1 malonic semialdehyde reductase [Polymorphobacter fuscus]MQT18055.1 malonic semialdehyde reductase [Polymorphobacter fuscus]NJC08688.1 3-hydroxypropanoate dehydrogenase [Polymorphobacter fuscus]
MSGTPLDDAALDLLFREARTYYSWDSTPVSEADLRALYDLVKMGPTSANCCPARFLFVASDDARARLAATASEANGPKILAAPVTAIIGFDRKFYDKLPQLFPHADARSWFTGDDAMARETAFRNSSLQGAYFILAARALGWDTGPMSGFDKAAVDAQFWAGTDVETNFICSLGKGTTEKLFPRSPRLAFEDAATIL